MINESNERNTAIAMSAVNDILRAYHLNYDADVGVLGGEIFFLIQPAELLAKSLNLHTHLRRKGVNPLILTLKTTCLTTGRQAQPAVQSHCPIQLNASPNQK